MSESLASVFLSYSHADKPLARQLAAGLSERGCLVWVDEGEIKIGESLYESIATALDQVDFVIALMSPASVSSDWCQKEIGLAMTGEVSNHGVTVLPLRIGDVPIPPTLKGKLYLDVEQDDVSGALDRILSSIRRYLSPPAPLPPRRRAPSRNGDPGGPPRGDRVGHTRGGLHPRLGRPFRQAYEEAGGPEVLGYPRRDDPSGFVGPWGPGWRQDLRGGAQGDARIMALDEESVVVMCGQWHEDYTHGTGFGPNSGPVLGYPVSAPIRIGTGSVVRLSGGEAGPGLMASDPHGHMRWIRGPIARAWLALGGPVGLGRPIGDQEDQAAGASQIQLFEYDALSVSPDGDILARKAGNSGRTEGIRLTDQVRDVLRDLEDDLRRFWHGSADAGS